MAPPVEGVLMECLYDTLGVERTVDSDKLKIAYRKMAMKWHPDKIQQSGGAGASPDAYQKATERFQQISRAYEVLSDPVERTWYDSHRERILSASASSANAAPGEFDLNLWPYFSPSAFSGFGDTGNGFYEVYREIFKKVNMQEKVFGRMYGNGDVGDAPELGSPDTPYQSVYSFYRYWQGFSSVKDFGWCDKYDVLQAPNRKVRRLMEDENNKVRKREKREFNNTVRQLATFVKKRDKRVIEKQLELQREQKQKEVERKARQLALEKDKQEQIRLYKEQAWTVPPEAEDWDSEEDTDDDDTVKFDKTAEDAECMICGKRFKSIKQLHNHERSKKHLENLAALKGAFRDDDEQVERLGRQLGIDISIQKKSKRKKAGVDSSKKSEIVQNSSEDENAELRMPDAVSDDDSDPAVVNKMHNQSDEESEDQQDTDLLERKATSNELPVSEDDDDDDEGMLASMLKLQQTRQMYESTAETNVEDAEMKNVAASRNGDDDEKDEDSVLAAMSNLQLNKQGAEASAQSDGEDSVDEAGAHEESVSEEKDLDEDEKSKKGKSRRRSKQDRKQAAVSSRFSASATDLEQSATNGDAATGGPSSSGASESARGVRELPPVKHSKLAHRGKKIKKDKKGAKQDSHTCQTCGEDFDSRTLLFKHITASNHAILKSK